MMGHKEPMINGDELDALSRAKRFYSFRPGIRKRIKKWFNRRVRKAARKENKE